MSAIVSVKILCNGRDGRPCPLQRVRIVEVESVSAARRHLAKSGWVVIQRQVDGHTRYGDRCSWCVGVPQAKDPSQPRVQPALSAAELLGDALPRRRRA
jgi:hypothetical protein